MPSLSEVLSTGPAADPGRPAPDALRGATVLALCQALYTSSVSIDLTLTGLVGYALATDKGLATLPFSLITVAAALTTVIASFLMARIGRRAGFLIGAGVGALGGSISVWAIFHLSFWAFCAGTATVGVFQAFAQYYRLAAADAIFPVLALAARATLGYAWSCVRQPAWGS